MARKPLRPMLERYQAQRWNGDREHVISAVAGHRHRGNAAKIALSAAAVERRVTIKYLLPEAALRHTNLIIVPRHGSEIAHDGEGIVR